MPEPTNHRAYARAWLANAVDWYSQIPDTEPAQRSTASALIAGAHFLGAIVRDGLDAEEQHQSEKFEATLLDDDTIETPSYGLGHIPDADIVAGLAPTWDNEPGGGAP